MKIKNKKKESWGIGDYLFLFCVVVFLIWCCFFGPETRVPKF